METQILPYTRETSEFLRMFDRVFDCLDVARRCQASKGKKKLVEYTGADDWRFQVQFGHIFC